MARPPAGLLRPLAVLATALDAPGAARAVRALTPAPALEEVDAAGVPATLARPAAGGPRPAALVLNGVTARGRRHPQVRALAEGLARVGALALVPDPEGLARGELTPATLEGTLAAAGWLAGRGDAREGRLALLGVSAGASLALLAAEDGRLAGRVSVVAGTAPYADLREVARIATTSTYRGSRGLVAWRARPFLALVIARSLAGALAPGPDRELLRAALAPVGEDDPDPLAPLRAVAPGGLGEEARGALALLLNRRPERFDALHEALSARLRAGLAALSPLRRAGAIRASVELASAPRDAYFPLDEARALAAASGGRLTVTTTLDHAVPRPLRGELADAARLAGWLARSLARAEGR